MDARRQSKAVFGNANFLSVAAKIQTKFTASPFTVRQVAAETKLADAVVRPVLKRLLEAEAVQDFANAGSEGSDRKNYFEFVDGPLWKLVGHFVSEREASDAGST